MGVETRKFQFFLVYIKFSQKCLTCTLYSNISCFRGLILLVAFNGKKGAVGKLELRFSRLRQTLSLYRWN